MERLPSYLEGPRLILRLWEPDDAEAAGVAIAESLPRLKPFMPWAADEPMTVEARRELFETWKEKWRAGGDSFLVMLHDDEIVGSTGLHMRGEENRVEIGYWVRTGYTGRGFATEASRMLTMAAFEIPEIEVVAIHHDVANVASRRVPEKLGFRLAREVAKEPKATGDSGVELQWEMSEEEWGG